MKPQDWAALTEGLLEAVLLIDQLTLRIVAANQAAVQLVGLASDELVGMPVVDLTAAPEDHYFWEDVAAGRADSIHSDTLIRSASGEAIEVERKVSRVCTAQLQCFYVVGLRDLRSQRRAETEQQRLLAEMRATLESTADGILVTDLQGGVRNYNRHFSRLWEVPEALLTQRNDAALNAHLASCVLDKVQYRQRLAEIEAARPVECCDVLLLWSGRILERVSTPQYSQGRAIGRVYAFRDITQRVDAESRQRLASKVFESSLEAIFVTAADFVILAVNPVCERLVGVVQGALVGSSARDLFQDVQDPGLFVAIERRLASEGVWEGEVWCRRGPREPFAAQLSWVLLRDEQGQVLNSIGFFKDNTERLAAQKRIEQLAYSDALTGLPNRLLLSQRVDFSLHVAERSGGKFAILFLDLDRFKTINDSLGHLFGDRVLVDVSKRLSECLRDVDTLSRLGGDEFVLFLHDADAYGAEIAAQRILRALALPFDMDGVDFSVSGSVGIALYPEDGKTLDELIMHADTAMYRVKERGRGSFRFYQPQMNVDLRARMKMDHAMRQAMANGLFALHYQPQICLRSGELLGAEALIRWTDAELGKVSPQIFIGLAEESGFIVPLGNWVLLEAVRQAALWQSAGHPVRVSINVSATQFQQADFVDRVAAAIAHAGLDPRWLELEVTESILIKDVDETLARLHALARLGLALSIDDFGTGYSSLGYLKKFPITKLKIDRSFVTDLPGDVGDRAIVIASIGMAHAMRMAVVAEGVENVAQRDFLAALQCDAFQGFLCSPALPAPAFEQLMQSLPTAGTAQALNPFHAM